MSLEEYKDSFSNIQQNLTRWLMSGQNSIHLVTGRDINVSVLKRLKSELPDDAVIAVAADNKYSLSAFAGAHYFEERQSVFTREELVKTAVSAGFDIKDIQMYYPYPDMLLPLVIYSDKYLPKCGELTNNYRNFGADRLYIFDESAKWDEIIKDGKFGDFANSFLMLLTGRSFVNENPVFIKYSNDRDDKYRICTRIYDNNGIKSVVKSPMTEAAKAHIANMAVNQKKLEERYKGFEDKYKTRISVNRCGIDKDSAIFEYLEWEPLEKRLLKLMELGDYAEVSQYVCTFADMVRYNKESGIWDIDLIFKNIFVNEAGDEWTIIDYEWTWEISGKNSDETADYIIQRSVYYLIADNPAAGFEKLALFELTATKEPKLEHRCYETDNAFEREFQKQVMGTHRTLGTIYNSTHGRLYDVGQLVEDSRNKEYQNSIEADAQFTDRHIGESHELVMDMRERNTVTIYPAHCCCFVYIRRISAKCKITTNGIRITKRLYAFTDTKPMIKLKTAGSPADTLKADLYVSNQGLSDSPVFEAVVKAFSWKRLLM